MSWDDRAKVDKVQWGFRTASTGVGCYLALGGVDDLEVQGLGRGRQGAKARTAGLHEAVFFFEKLSQLYYYLPK